MSVLLYADELSLFQSTFRVVYSVAGLFALTNVLQLIQYHQTVCSASGVGKLSLIQLDRVFRAEEAIRMRMPCHIVFRGWCATNLVGCGPSRSHTGSDIQKLGKKNVP